MVRSDLSGSGDAGAAGSKGTAINALRTSLAGLSLAVLTACATVSGVALPADFTPNAVAGLNAFTPSYATMDPSVGIEGIEIAEGARIENGTIVYPAYENVLHVDPGGRVAYDRFPPIGGPHDAAWAACDGTVYSQPVRNEHMVHSLEHGAVWITYDPERLPADGVRKLVDLVTGESHLMLSPYPGLGSPISLQYWGHQLRVDHAGDSRILAFIVALRQNPFITPEFGAACSQPRFDPDNPPPFDATDPGPDAMPMVPADEPALPEDELPTGPEVVTTA